MFSLVTSFNTESKVWIFNEVDSIGLRPSNFNVIKSDLNR